MTPGPTTPSQPRPFGIGGAGSSAFFHGSRPDLASMLTVSPWASGMTKDSTRKQTAPNDGRGLDGHEQTEERLHRAHRQHGDVRTGSPEAPPYGSDDGASHDENQEEAEHVVGVG